MALHRSYPRVIQDEQKARQPAGAIGRTFTNPIRRLIDRALIKKACTFRALSFFFLVDTKTHISIK